MGMNVDFYKHNIDENDIERAAGVLRSIFLTTGSVVAEFENAFASYLGLKSAIGVTSCTAALHLCLLAWGIGEGDEVITTPMTFCATSNAILHAGATPVFVDVEEDTGNINAELIESHITDRTRAIMPVHLYGQMCDMKRIRAIADKHRLIVIEDAAHCVEGQRDGMGVGQFGHAACFSFYATKNLTSGEGGAIATTDGEKAELLKVLRLHGINKSAADRHERTFQHYDMRELGWKYNMDNIQASLLLGQLDRLKGMWDRREALARRYEDALQSIPALRIMKNVPQSRHARHLFTILTPRGARDEFLVGLQKSGVGVVVNYRAVHLLDYYRKHFGYAMGAYPVAEDIGDRTLSLPLYPKLSDSEQDYVIHAVAEQSRRFQDLA